VVLERISLSDDSVTVDVDITETQSEQLLEGSTSDAFESGSHRPSGKNKSGKHILPSLYLQRKRSDPLNPKRRFFGTSFSILLEYSEVTPSHVKMKTPTRTMARSSYAMLHCIFLQTNTAFNHWQSFRFWSLDILLRCLTSSKNGKKTSCNSCNTSTQTLQNKDKQKTGYVPRSSAV